LVLGFLIKFKPLRMLKLNVLEIINETTFLILNYISYTFTDYVKPEMRDYYGCVFIGILTLNLVINILVTAIEVIITIKNIIKRRCHKRSRNI
jgi:hypothetical protein